MEHSYSRRGGYTLIELLVVLAIILIITSITIVNQGAFNKTFLLANTAYDVALTIRSAENFGLGSRAGGAANVAPNTGYGVHFDSTDSNSFILFADTYTDTSPGKMGSCHTSTAIGPSGGPGTTLGDCVYTANQDQKINTYMLGNGISISNLCVFTTFGVSECSNSGFAHSLNALDAVFARPNSDVTVRANGGDASLASWYPILKTCIALTSPQGGLRSIWILPTGEITVNTTVCQ
ncbi:MAG: pilus assembly FimT family protein [Minisyncoccota bacterium]